MLWDGMRSVGRIRHKWEDNIKVDHKEVGVGVWTGIDCLVIGSNREFVKWFHKSREFFDHPSNY
jgi:hypothetical protein